MSDSLEAEENLYENESDFDHEPDTDDDDDEDYGSSLPTLSAIDYVNGAKSIIYANENITNENALAINQNLQEYLREMKRKLESLLHNVREKYKSNELLRERLIDESTTSKKDLRCTSFFFCGKPYFKQMDLFSAPLNSDYMYRRNVKNEYFPIDHLDTFKPWSAKDKLFLVNGVKEQLLTFLMSNQRDAARNVKSNTRHGAKARKSILDDRSLQSKKLTELFELAKGSNFVIDWFTISTKHLDERHSTLECMGIWMNNLIPSLNRSKWTDQDDEKLLGIADEYNCQNWNQIGKELNGRSGYDCIIRYQGLINDHNVLKHCRWTKEEDEVLREAVETCRIGSFIPWTKVTDKLPMRSKMQVYHRYMFTLNPSIKKEKFTVEEDCIITAAVKQYGTNFHKFSTNLLPGRTLVQIRHRYTNVLKHVDNFKEWTVEDDVRLMELTKEFGTSDWVNISKQLVHHTRLSCRSRYVTISKFLEKNPNSEVKDVPRRARKLSTNVKENNWMEEIVNYKKKLHADEAAQSREGQPATAAGQDFHEFFKFSYNFELKQLCEADEPASDKCRVISHILQNTVYPKDHKLLYGPTDCRIDMASMISCDDTKEYMLPPNRSTALMLRGLSVLYPNTEKMPESVPADSPALQLFKKRFFLLLYSSAVASYTTMPSTRRQSTDTADSPAKRRKS
ncbi:hypothetical protein HA402_007480 [Bradysia odoriphaga]|nr:hypothetical protein HA402_007480 [Bradysia odoriphaga]